MTDAVDDQGEPRGFASRAGVTALNLISPGLGLLRLGAWRAGAFFLLVPFALFMLVTVAIGYLPLTTYGRILSGLFVLLGVTVVQYLVPIVLTWRRSRFRARPGQWSRWYSLTAIAMVDLILLQVVQPAIHSFFKPFYLPAESMAPTIGRGDKIMADMRWRGPPSRGDIILFNGPDNVRVSRVVAIAGDRIALRNGLPILNGTAAIQRRRGEATFAGYAGPQTAAQFEEWLPGVRSSHRILDAKPAPFDTMAELLVPPGHVFVLGDNRDFSADSRVPLPLGGVGMVPMSALIGRPMYVTWSQDRSKIGTQLDE
jgi:signal peptidase I